MARIKRRAALVDYSLCCQTVTVYHREGDTCIRRVIRDAFLDFKKVESIGKTGSKEVNSFLLVVPCGEQAVFVGDKVILGEGPEVTGREDWAALLPAKYHGLVIVQYVDPKYWRGRLIHVEAGG